MNTQKGIMVQPMIFKPKKDSYHMSPLDYLLAWQFKFPSLFPNALIYECHFHYISHKQSIIPNPQLKWKGVLTVAS